MKRVYDKALIDQIANVYGGDKSLLSEFSKALLEIIREGLIRDGHVRIHQFGTFKLKWMQARQGINPQTREPLQIEGRPRVLFVPAKSLKEQIEPVVPDLIPLIESDIEQQIEEQPTATFILTTELDNTEVIQEVTSTETSDMTEEAPAALSDEIEEQKIPSDRDNTVVVEEAVVQQAIIEIDREQPQPHEEEPGEHYSRAEDQPVVITSDAEAGFESPGRAELRPEDIPDEEIPAPRSEVNSEQDVSIERTLVTNVGLDTHELTHDLSEYETHDTTKAQHKGQQANRRPLFMVAAILLVLLTGLVFLSLQFEPLPPAVTEQQVAVVEVEHPVIITPELAPAEPLVEDIMPSEEPIKTDTADISGYQEPSLAVDIKTESDTTFIAETVTEAAVEPEQAQIATEDKHVIVSTQKYSDVKRATAETAEPFFTAVNYQLVNGDSLWRLAKKNYVDPFYWPHIYQANRRKITNPDSLHIGKTIVMPTLYGHPSKLTDIDRHNIAKGYYFNYLYHKQKGNPYAYFSLIGVDRFDPGLLIEFKDEIEKSDVDNLALLSE